MSSPPELPGVRHPFLDGGGLRTRGALAGPEDAPAVVLVHAWLQNGWAWREVIPPSWTLEVPTTTLARLP